jgi:hypothetical protein
MSGGTLGEKSGSRLSDRAERRQLATAIFLETQPRADRAPWREVYAQRHEAIDDMQLQLRRRRRGRRWSTASASATCSLIFDVPDGSRTRMFRLRRGSAEPHGLAEADALAPRVLRRPTAESPAHSRRVEQIRLESSPSVAMKVSLAVRQ